MKESRIRYERIANAQLIYGALGYSNIETPWIVSPQAVRATLPLDKRMIETVVGALVGSGEQGFIQKMLEKTLEPGRYQTTTPCFQDGERPFMKIELVWYAPEDQKTAFEKLLNDALSCQFEVSDAETLDVVQTPEGYCICANGVIVGYYGVRQMAEHMWVYGTGLSEPCLTLAMNSHSHSHSPEPQSSTGNDLVECANGGINSPES